MSGEWHVRLGYLLWQARACMCAVCSRHAHIIYLFTHMYLPYWDEHTLLRCKDLTKLPLHLWNLRSLSGKPDDIDAIFDKVMELT